MGAHTPNRKHYEFLNPFWSLGIEPKGCYKRTTAFNSISCCSDLYAQSPYIFSFVLFFVQRASVSFGAFLLSLQSCKVLPSFISRFSSRLFLCLGTSSKESSTIFPVLPVTFAFLSLNPKYGYLKSCQLIVKNGLIFRGSQNNKSLFVGLF
jgi:hypothetical protein